MTKELDRLLTITDLSEMLGVPVDTLSGWRHRGEGPAGYRIGRHVRYRRAAVEAWLDTQADRRQPGTPNWPLTVAPADRCSVTIVAPPRY
jgi:excisionase family DNA binding protein